MLFTWQGGVGVSTHMSQRAVAKASGMLRGGPLLVAHSLSGLLKLRVGASGSVPIHLVVGGNVGRHGGGCNGEGGIDRTVLGTREVRKNRFLGAVDER